MLLKKCKYVVTQNEKREILKNVDILIQENTIADIGKNLKGTPVIDCSERIVMPGLINAHTHLGMTHLRGVADDKELNEWLAAVHKEEATFTEKDIEEGNYLGITEAIRTGTTTVVDTFFHEHLAAKAAEELGIRFYGAHGILNNHPLSEKTMDIPKSTNDRITFCLGPHAMYTTDDNILKRVREAATRENALIMMHLAETRKERAEFREKNGTLPVQHLEEIGFLGPDVLLVHCNWLTKGELDILNKHHVKVVHCPQSNMKLAGGSCMPIKEMQERNITVALGTDSTASNNSLDMFREMHVAALLHKQHYWDPTVTTAQDILDMATLNGAAVLGRDDIGSLQEGKLADLITLDLNDVNLIPHNKERVPSHLVYAATGMNVSEVVINGELLVRDKVFQ